MLYICTDCRQRFDEPHRYVERHGLEHGPYEQMSCCPFCGGDYERALTCDECGEVLPESEICLNDHGRDLCAKCYAAEEEAIERRAAEEAEYDKRMGPTLYANDKPLVTVDYTETACKDSIADVYEQYEDLDDELLTRRIYERPSYLSTVRLDDVPWGSLLRKPLTSLADCWEYFSCSIVADHDPTVKADAESRYERFVLESVLSTSCIPGQWRGMIARALLFWLHSSINDIDYEDCRQYSWIAAQLDPSVYSCYTTQVIDAYRVRDTAHRCTMHAEALALLRHDLEKARKNRRGLVVDIEGHKYALDAAAVDILMNPDFVSMHTNEQTGGEDDE